MKNAIAAHLPASAASHIANIDVCYHPQQNTALISIPDSMWEDCDVDKFFTDVVASGQFDHVLLSDEGGIDPDITTPTDIEDITGEGPGDPAYDEAVKGFYSKGLAGVVEDSNPRKNLPLTGWHFS